MNNNLSFINIRNKHNKSRQIEAQPIEEPPTKPNRIYFNDFAYENNEKYQDLRRDKRH